MHPELVLPRCRRGDRCADRERLTDDDGKHLGWDGLVLYQPGLCAADWRNVKSAIQHLPGDIDELSELLVPSGEQRYRDPDMPAQPRIKLYSPVPLDLNALTLQEWIDSEVTMWATATARVVDLPPTRWSPLNASRMRQNVRVIRACFLLIQYLDEFLALPVTETPARSRTARRADGHDPDTTTVMGDEYWANRDGITAGLTLLELHRQAEAMASRQAADRLPLPCPTCRRPALIRLHSNGKVECKACGERITDQDYDGHLFGLGTRYDLDKPRTPAPKETPMPEQLPAGVQSVRPLDARVHAMPVTADNLDDVRLWCAGTIGKALEEDGHTVRWVNVPGSLTKAYPGDVVLRQPALDRPGVFRVLTADEYAAGYEQAA